MSSTAPANTPLPRLTKRKARAEDAGPATDADGDAVLGDTTTYDSDGDSDGSDPSFINVDFDFRSPSEIDEPALRRLLRQLFHTHANALELHHVSERIISLAAQKSIGTVIKVEGDEDQDPFAFVSCIPLGASATQDKASALLSSYLAKQLPANSPISAALAAPTASAVMYLHERFINLPAQTAPPLYRMLTEEVVASSTGASTTPSPPQHVVFFSRVFSQEAYSDDEDAGGADEEDDEDRPRGLKGAAKRRKGAGALAKKASSASNSRGERREWGYFRPEDEILERHAAHTHTFRFPPPQEAEESYESPLYGRIVLVDWEKIASGAIWDEMDRDLVANAVPAAVA